MDLFETFQQSTVDRLGKHLIKLEQALKEAQESGLDISANYHFRQGSREEDLQDKVRLATRDIQIYYIDATAGCVCGCGNRGGLGDEGFPPSLERVTPIDMMGHPTGLPEDFLKRILTSLQVARELFGNHAFHHVIEGRIAFIVKREAGTGNRIPEYFNSYRGFQFKPWNEPWANYCCHLDLKEHGQLEMIPPEYR